MTDDAPVYVVAGALVDARGRVLIAERPAGKAQAGRWEFPGGKKLPHETPRDALNRELLEELGVQVARATPLLVASHRYSADAPPVVIDCWRVESWRGEIAALDGQRLRWCGRDELVDADILEADRPIVTALRLPSLFVRASDPEALSARAPGFAPGVARERVAWVVPAHGLDAGLVRRLRERGDYVFALDPDAPAQGNGRVYSQAHAVVHARGAAELVGRTARSVAEAREAAAAGADFLLLPDRTLSGADLDAIASLGVPFYVNVETPGPALGRATGKLWWRSGGLGGGLERL